MVLGEQEVGSFSVSAELAEYGYCGDYLSLASIATPVVVPYEWTLPSGAMAAISLEQGRKRSVSHHLSRGELGKGHSHLTVNTNEYE